MWRNPVGEGAKRVTTGSVISGGSIALGGGGWAAVLGPSARLYHTASRLSHRPGENAGLVDEASSCPGRDAARQRCVAEPGPFGRLRMGWPALRSVVA